MAKFYAAQWKDTFLDFASDFARFLTNDLPPIAGTPWTIVEAYDDSASSRQIPSDETTMDSFSGTFSWKDNTVGVNDWIVLRSSRGTTEFQVYFKITSSTQLQMKLLPLDNWVTDTGDVTANPVLPLVSVGNGTGLLSLNGFSYKALYSIVADNGMCSFLFDNLSSGSSWTYFGECFGGHGEDTRPFVIWDAPTSIRFSDQLSTSGNWNRISPFDNSTVLTTGVSSTWYFVGDADNVHRDSFSGFPGLMGSRRPLPVGVYFPGAGHKHFTGFLNNVFSASVRSGLSGTFAGNKYMFRNSDGGSNSEPSICWTWNLLTSYPPAPY